MKQYTDIYTIRFSKEQSRSLRILKIYKISIPKFIRQAIKEKIKRDWKLIKEEKTKDYCPF